MTAIDRDTLLEAARQALREGVCRTCLDAHDDGSCGLTTRECAMERQLPQLVEAVLSVQSGRMSDYEAALRARVCSRCLEQDASGSCHLRNAGECALSTYLPLVVDALDGLRGQ